MSHYRAPIRAVVRSDANAQTFRQKNCSGVLEAVRLCKAQRFRMLTSDEHTNANWRATGISLAGPNRSGKTELAKRSSVRPGTESHCSLNAPKGRACG